MINLSNTELKEYAKSKGVKLSEIACAFGIWDTTLSKWLRVQMTPEREKQFINYVDQIAKEKRCSK